MNIPSKHLTPYFSANELVEVIKNNQDSDYTIDNIKTAVASGNIKPCIVLKSSITAMLIIKDTKNKLTQGEWIKGSYTRVSIPDYKTPAPVIDNEILKVPIKINILGGLKTAHHCFISGCWRVLEHQTEQKKMVKYSLESIDLPFHTSAFSSKFRPLGFDDFVFIHDDVVKLINRILGRPEQNASTTQKQSQNESEEFKALYLAHERFWLNYDPTDPTTAPLKSAVVEFLESKGFAKTLAEKADTILRGGRNRPN